VAIRAQLKRLHSPDLLHLKSDLPDEPQHCAILVQAHIGPENLDGEETFDFLVCTPSYLTEELSNHPYIFGRHRLIVTSFSLNTVQSAIAALCSRTWGRDWNEVAHKLARYGAWEYEDDTD
jgi:hypothetical protein